MFSFSLSGLMGTDANNVDSANENRKKRLIIGGATLGALVLIGGIGGIIWYNSKSPANPEPASKPPGDAGGGGGNERTVTKQAVPIIYRLLTTAKENKPLTIGVLISIFVVLAAVIALAVYFLTSNKQVLDDKEQATEQDLNGEVVKEENDGAPVLPITLAGIAALLVGAVLFWQFYLKPRRLAEEAKLKTVFPKTLAECGNDAQALFAALQKLRSEMPPASRCVIPEGGASTADKPLRVQIKYGETLTTAHCPDGFNLNSVWWAFTESAEKVGSFVWEYNGQFVLYEPDFSEPEYLRSIWLQNHKLQNIPGTLDIPPFPQPLAEGTDGDQVFRDEYDVWHKWAVTDQNCKLETEDASAVPVAVTFVKENIVIRCRNGKPDLKTVYSALTALPKFNNQIFLVRYGPENTYIAQVMAADERNRVPLWRMYEAFSPLYKPTKYFA